MLQFSVFAGQSSSEQRVANNQQPESGRHGNVPVCGREQTWPYFHQR